MSAAGAGLAATANLAAVGDEATELTNALVVDLCDLRLTEKARLPAQVDLAALAGPGTGRSVPDLASLRSTGHELILLSAGYQPSAAPLRGSAGSPAQCSSGRLTRVSSAASESASCRMIHLTIRSQARAGCVLGFVEA